MDIDFHSQYFESYMKAVERTESPRLFHLWASISAIACAIGRRSWLPFGMVGNIYANHFILLVGPPAVRKSSALNVSYKMLKDSTDVRFAPTDTGGQRQGLIRAMAQTGEKSEALEELIDSAITGPWMDETTSAAIEESKTKVLEKSERHVLAAYWSELSGALGQANYAMMDFLVQTYDAGDYRYTTRNGEIILPDTLFNILACTTPASMSVTMPPLAEGHGFLSRFILVHGDKNYQDVVWPELPKQDDVNQVKETLSYVNQNYRGPLSVDAKARAFAESLYRTQLDIADPRFAHYKSRRFSHLLKLAIVLAASRHDHAITLRDMELANTILRVTERGMPDAMGQFGLSPLAKVKQGIVEFLRQADAPVTAQTIQAAFHRDARPQDIIEAIGDLIVADIIVMLPTSKGSQLYAAKKVKREIINEELAEFLTVRKES